MNMKKTIAAIAAGAVAISAMATTVSAFDNQTLTYNLVKTVYTHEFGSVTLSARFNAISLANFQGIVLKDASGKILEGENVTVTLNVYNDAGARTYTQAYTTDKDSNNYTPNFLRKEVAGAPGTPATGYIGLELPNTVPLVATGDIAISFTVKHDEWNFKDINNNISSMEIYGSDDADSSYTAGNPTKAVDTWAETEGPVTATASAFTATNDNKEKKYPFKTALNLKTDLISYLETNSYNLVDKKGKSYNNVTAVLNDAIANYDDVTFVFNTATRKLKDVDTDGYYNDDWDAIDTFLSFGEHLYNYNNNNTGYIADYNWYNLFTGALVVNGYHSMSLADTNVFNYAATSISFNWEDVMTTNSGSQINPWVTYLQQMYLVTSQTWYWDNLQVVLANTEVDTVDTTAGEIADEDLIDDEEIVEDEDIVEDEEIEDVEVPEVVEEAPAVAANPKTGNASVALAVIPVALAAAAIVAKKRG